MEAKLRAMGASALHMMEYFKWMYGTHSDIYIQANKELELYRSAQGVRQGDMPASLLFSLVFTDAAIAADVDGAALTSLWLYLDDITQVDTVPAVIAYKKRLVIELAKLNLSLNMKKCRALVDRCTPEEVALLLDAGFQLDYGCTRSLGSPIGAVEACKAFILRKVAAWVPFWEKLQHEDLHPSTALTILKVCGNVKFEHLARSLHPDVCQEAANQFEAIVQQTAARILGMKKHRFHVDVQRAVLSLLPYGVVAGTLYEATCKTIDGERVVLWANVKACLQRPYEALSLPPFVGRLVRAAQGPTAKDVIAPTLAVKAHNCVHGMQVRCGIPEDHVPHVCSCGHVFCPDVDEDAEVPESLMALKRIETAVYRNGHLMTCPHNDGFNKTCRHHAIVHAIKRVLDVFHVYSTHEPSYLSYVLRPDLHVSGRFASIIDVTVVDSVMSGLLDALQTAANEKHVKYDALAEHHKLRFFPVVIDTYGALHEESLKFISRVAKSVSEHLRRDFRNQMQSAIQHALVQGNAQVIDEAVNRLQHRCGVWF